MGHQPSVVFLVSLVLSLALAEMMGLESTEVLVATFLAVVIIAPVVEETVKWGTGRVALRKTRFLDEPVDAMVYGTAIGLGFAGVENVLYLLEGVRQFSLEAPVACAGLTLTDCAITQILPVRAIGTTLMHGLAGGFGGHAVAKVPVR